MPTDYPRNPTALALASWSAVLAVLVGSMVLLGWAFDIATLQSILPGWVSMKANTAASFILIGVALLLTTRPPANFNPQLSYLLSRLALLCGWLAGLIGLLTLGEYLFGWNFGVDNWLISEPIGVLDIQYPGRMEPDTALSFVLLASALPLIRTSHKTRFSISASACLGMLVALLALAAILAYFTPELGTYGWLGIPIIEIHTTALLALLGMCVFAISWQPNILPWSLPIRSTATFACIIALVVFIGFSTIRSQRWLQETSHQVAYHEDILGKFRNTLIEVINAQAHTGSYIITGDERFKTLYFAAADSSRMRLDELSKLTAGNPQQQLAQIEAHVTAQLQLLQNAIDSEQNQVSRAERNKMLAHGEELLDNLRNAFDQIEKEHAQIIQQLKQESKGVSRFTYLIIFTSTLVRLIILIIVMFWLNSLMYERERKGSALRESEARLQLEMNRMPIGYIVWDTDFRVVNWNPAAEKIFGFSADEARGHQPYDLIVPKEAMPHIEAIWRQLCSGDETAHSVNENTTKDGRTILCSWINTPLIQSDGIITGVLSMVQDITERKMAEEKLKNSEELYRTMIENSNDMIWGLTPDARFSFINQRAAEVTGYAIDDWLGKTFAPMVEPDDLPMVLDIHDKIMTGERVHYEVRGKKADGGELLLSVNASPIIKDGKVSGTISFASDITERKKAEQVLHKANVELSLFRNLIDNSSDAIMVVDPKTQRLLDFNDTLCKTLGYSRKELLTMTPADFDPSLSPDTVHIIEEQFRQSGGAHFEGKHRRKDGSTFPVELRIKLAYFDKPYAITIASDITERKCAEKKLSEHLQRITAEHAQLVEANRQLAQAQSQLLQSEKMAAIGLLAAGVAHEINNPVGYVNSNLGTLGKYLADIFVVVDKSETIGELVKVDNPLLDELRKFKATINLDHIREDTKALIAESQQGLERVKKIVLDLNEFSHANSVDQWEWADVHHGLNSTLNIVWGELKYKCEVVKEYGTLPKIFCLPAQLNQVFMNLLVNAAQSIEVRGKITLRTGQEGDNVWIEVSDTGKGIHAEDISRLFDPFFTTKPVGKGTGLGLSVSYKIVEKHHGKIEVHSEIGKGSTFRVWLPVQQPDPKEKT